MNYFSTKWIVPLFVFTLSGSPLSGRAQGIPKDSCSSAAAQPTFAGLLDKAMLLRSSDKIDQSEDAVKKVLAVAPDNPRALYSLGMIMADRGQYGGAEETLKKAVLIHGTCEHSGPLSSSIYNNIGWVQIQQKRYSDAQATLSKALTLKDMPATSRTKALSNLGYSYAMTGNFADARPILEEAVKQQSKAARYTLDVVERAEQLGKANEQQQ